MSQYSKPTNCEGKIIPCEECDRCKFFMTACQEGLVSWEDLREDLITNHLIQEHKKKQEKKDLDRRREILGISIQTNKKHHFVTASLDPKKVVNVEEINSKLNYKYCKDAIICYEFNPHPHFHMLVEAYDNGKIIPKSTIVRDLSRALNLKPNFIDVASEPWNYQKRRGYLLGDKKNEKLELIKKDRLYREKNNIDEYYIL